MTDPRLVACGDLDLCNHPVKLSTMYKHPLDTPQVVIGFLVPFIHKDTAQEIEQNRIFILTEQTLWGFFFSG